VLYGRLKKLWSKTGVEKYDARKIYTPCDVWATLEKCWSIFERVRCLKNMRVFDALKNKAQALKTARFEKIYEALKAGSAFWKIEKPVMLGDTQILPALEMCDALKIENVCELVMP
jgi:hypothetical protein